MAEMGVPDFPGARNLSGRLGHPDPAWPKVRYLGPLCRFRAESMPWDKFPSPDSPGARIDVLALLSGPEPQRAELERKLLDALLKLPGTRVLMRGLPGGAPSGGEGVAAGGLTVVDHVPERRLQSYLARADRVICRSGYTTVMELAGLGKKNTLMIPTPGQPEQEYLAEHLRALGLAVFQNQKQLDLPAGLAAAEKAAGFAALYQGTQDPAWPEPLSALLAGHPLLMPRPPRNV